MSPNIVGGNFRLDALQAAILLVKLQHLDDWTSGRQRNASKYSQAFEAKKLPMKLPTIRPSHRHIFNQYVIEVDRRDELRDFLKDRNIGSEIYYPVPLHLQECFSDLGYEDGIFPVAENAARKSLALPVYSELSGAQLNYVVETVAEFLAGN